MYTFNRQMLIFVPEIQSYAKNLNINRLMSLKLVSWTIPLVCLFLVSCLVLSFHAPHPHLISPDEITDMCHHHPTKSHFIKHVIVTEVVPVIRMEIMSDSEAQHLIGSGVTTLVLLPRYII